ncbi:MULTISPECIES: glycosyltransferase [Pseudomonas]|uniref:glycosyltransferase n=1 Tax=Pseudomonas TaxID=286 RepID=UPI000CFEB0F5|nr:MULTISPECIES: glycosyltransferase [Pseudomonas]PRA46705.1 hypothetical protein CQZ98_22950 [Pseudomonas sp. MYb115]QXN48508.1 glycosyltransferase [Pseudomonas fluorescens]WSO22818.1 glycosyltransferase [Pseudomonas fluorescens]
MKQVISVLYELAEQGGGVTRVSLARTAALAVEGCIASVAVLSYDERLEHTIQNLVVQGRIREDLRVLSFYHWFAHKASCAIAGAEEHEQSTAEHLGVFIKKQIDRVNGAGFSVNRYLTRSKYVFIEEFISDENGVEMVVLYQPGGRPLKFNSLDSVHAYWLKCLSVKSLPSFLLADSIGAADAICRVEGQGIYRVLMMHSNHLAKPHTVGAAIAPKYAGVIRGIEHCDRLVLLTQGQLQDVREQFPSGRYSVIGNLVTIGASGVEIKRDPNLAVVVSRLHGVKRIKTIIKSFAKVIARNPLARLEIWGAGEQEQSIKEFIDSLDVQDSVKLMGFATDVSQVFMRASVSLGMSASEGFGISFAESLGYGVPLVSTKTNYGPQEIVTNGVDGFVVENEEEFIDKVELLLGDAQLVESMALKGRESALRFTAGPITALWLSLFSELMARPTGRSVGLAPEGNVIENMVSSKVGWIYLPRVNDDATINSYRSAKKVHVLSVVSERAFVGETVDLLVGAYEVDEMVFDQVKSRYRFRLMKDGVSFRAPIASRVLKFVLF